MTLRRHSDWAWLGTAGWLLASATLAHAQEDRRQQCVEAYESGQRLKKTGDLIDAASRLAFCANPTCPRLMRDECASRLNEVKAATPSVLLSVKFSGARVPVRVSIDGQARAWADDATSLTVNPGRHELRVEADGAASQSVPLLLGEGERATSVEVTFGSETRAGVNRPPLPVRSALPPTRGSTPTAAIVVTGSSLLGAGAFAYFGLTARARESDLEQQCAPSCSPSDVAAVKRDYLFANLGLGLGIASLVGGGILFWMHFTEGPGGTSHPTPVALEVRPTYLGVVGGF